jgi:GWxTD domain-containing protein
MLKRHLTLWMCALSFSGFSQSIASLNLKYLYDPQSEVNFQFKLVNENTQMTVYYNLQLTAAARDPLSRYAVSWERRESFVQQHGTPLAGQDSATIRGKISFPVPEKPWLLVAKVTDLSASKQWFYTQVVEAKYPVDGYLEGPSGVVLSPYVYSDTEYFIRAAQPGKPVHLFLYKTDFLPASPPQAEKETQVDRFLFADSSFDVPNGGKVVFHSEGLYLAQQDTLGSQGFVFRVAANSFPRINRMMDIADPLVFVSTKAEHDDLVAANGDKSRVDKVILDITHDTDRAKTFMRSYFRRVELADQYFTTYKEGWKTDRGMLYIVFGLPDEVSRTEQTETWTYRDIKERFTFLKKYASVYQPQFDVLLRNSRFAANWFSTIDFWRKSRF